MSEFTPGPWRQLGYEIVGGEGTPQGRSICQMTCGSTTGAPIFAPFRKEHREHEPIINANARLIAAAPELYAALACLVDDAESHQDGDDRSMTLDITISRARAALAKATGDET